MNRDYNINHFDIVKDILKNTPNVIYLNDSYDYKIILPLINEFKIIHTLDEHIPYEDEEHIIDSKILASIDEYTYISYVISDKLSEFPTISNITIYQSILNLSESKVADIKYKIDELIKNLNIFSLENEDSLNNNSKLNDINNLNYLCVGKNGMYLSPLEINDNIDVNLCYNKETLNRLKDLNNQIHNQDYGLWILSGKYGYGKTSCLKYIANKNKEVNFTYLTHSSLDSTINSFEIFDFILNGEKTIFIIDDFERLYNGFDLKLNQTMTSISQILDNFLFKKSKVGFIIILNKESDVIIDDLKELNSFKTEIEFDSLEKNKVDKIIKKLDIDLKSNKNGLSLSDLLNNRKIVEKKYKGF